MDDQQFAAMLAPYNPWWAGDEAIACWEQSLPDYRRPVVGEILGDLRDASDIHSL